MKKLFTLLLSLMFTAALWAQLPDNSVAPDFTMTDLQGNEWNLYDILETGKPVVIDASATWCGPCWNYHQAHTLENLYNTYGPEGTDELMVLWIEADPSTNLACITNSPGCNSSTQGDWTEGVSYPIADYSPFNDLYNINYFPTLYLVCPNHLVREVGQLNLTAMYQQVQNCPEPTPGTEVTAFNLKSDYPYSKVCGTPTITPSWLLLNSGTETIDSMEVELRVNGQLKSTYVHKDSIRSFFPVEISLPPVTIPGTAIMRASITKINGQAITPIVKQTTFFAAKTVSTQQLTLEIRTDSYGSETYWEITDEGGSLLARGGNLNVGPNGNSGGINNPSPGAYGNDQTFMESIVLPDNGCYFLRFVDAYGDGLCDGSNNGYFKLYETANPTNILMEGDCDFSIFSDPFVGSGIVGVEEIVDLSSLRLFPNPATDQLNVSFDLLEGGMVDFLVVNPLGQIVYRQNGQTFGNGKQTVGIPTQSLRSGVYQLVLQTEKGATTRNFTVAK